MPTAVLLLRLWKPILQLIANKEAWAIPWKRKKIEQMNLLLQGALQAESLVGLKMNVPSAKLDDKVLKLFPV